MLNRFRSLVAWVFVGCMACGLLFAALAFFAAWEHWVSRGLRPTPGDNLPPDFRSILQFSGVGVLALFNTLAFGLVFARRGSNLLAPIAYLLSSFIQTFWAAIFVITWHKAGAMHQDVFGKGGWWAPQGWVSLWEVAGSVAIVCATTAACLAWNVWMSSWRGLDEGRLAWLLRRHVAAPVAM